MASYSTDPSAVPISENNTNQESAQSALGSHMAGLNQSAYENDLSHGGEILEDRTAAAASVQLHGHTGENLSSGGTRRFNPSTSALGMSNFYDHTNLYQSRSETGIRTVPYSQTGVIGGSVHSSVSQQTAPMHMQDTVTNLSNTVSALQQQQAQITNALSSLTSMIQQGVHSGLQQESANEHNSVGGISHLQRNSGFGRAVNTNTDSDYNVGYPGQEPFSGGSGQSREPGSRGFGRSYGFSRDFNESHQQEWSEDRPLPQAWMDPQSHRRRQVSQSLMALELRLSCLPLTEKKSGRSG